MAECDDDVHDLDKCGNVVNRGVHVSSYKGSSCGATTMQLNGRVPVLC